MLYYTIKIGLTVILIVAISEIAKRHTGFAALVASLPLTSLLAFTWLYIDTGSAEKVAELSRQVFWLVLPSLPLFVLLPALIRAGLGFWLALGASALTTAGIYAAMLPIARRLGVEL